MTTTSKQTRLISGDFTRNGNFTAYNSKGERIFINKAQMAALGYEKGGKEKPSFPLFAMVGEREFSMRDADGNLTEEKFTRVQALSLFKTQDELFEAAHGDTLLELASRKALETKASAAGLTEKQIEAVLASAI